MIDTKHRLALAAFVAADIALALWGGVPRPLAWAHVAAFAACFVAMSPRVRHAMSDRAFLLASAGYLASFAWLAVIAAVEAARIARLV